jgi:hypothetical protein
MLRLRRPPVLQCGLGAVAFAASLASGSAAQAGITGVCPDGSIFIAPREELIPCEGAKRVEPDEVPPMRPEYLPRPYTWQVYNEKSDPNNAYNMVDSARRVRALRDGRLPSVDGGPQDAQSQQSAVTPGEPTRRATGPLDLGLTDGELRDLYYIVELSQRDAPASFSKETAAGADVLSVTLAHSLAFEARFAEAWRGRRERHGPVLLFTAVARAVDAFYANFTFSQGPLAFQPRVDDALQFGVLQGRLGPMDPNTAVLGYVVLSDRFDLTEPMDVYWNDRRISVTFEP